MSFFSSIETWIKEEVSKLYSALQPGLEYLEKNVPADLINIAEAVLKLYTPGVSWTSVILPAVIQEAKSAGIALAKGAITAEQTATVALNTAQTNLIAQGTATGTAAEPAKPTSDVPATAPTNPAPAAS